MDLPTCLNVLILDDSPADVELIVTELRRAGFDPQWTCVQSEAAFLKAIHQSPDLILAEYDLQPFGALQALERLRTNHISIPLLIISNTLTEDIAVDAIRHGASEFLFKDRLGRLKLAVAAAFEGMRLRDDRARIDEKLIETESLLRSLTDQTLVGLQILQGEKYVYANPKIAEIFGYTVDELLSLKSWIEVVAPVDRERVLDQVRRRHAGTTPTAHYVFRGQRKDGTLIDVEVRSDRVEYRGRPAARGLLLDVTDRNRSVESLRASEERFRRAFDSTNMPMVITSLDHQFLRMNEAFARLFGYSQEQLLQMSMPDITHPADLSSSYEQRVPLLAGQADYFEMEKRYVHRDGSVIWALTNVSLIRDAEGYPMQYVGQVQDITQRRQTLEELQQTAASLEQANRIIEEERARLAERVDERTAELRQANNDLIQASRFKSEFLATMSHELRTPLNGILGMNELLLRTELTPKQKEFVEACISSGRSLLQLINDVLDISKIESGKFEVDLRECDLESLVYDIVSAFSHSIRQKGLTLTCHVSPDASVLALCDDHRLRQVLVNLVGNAMKFTPPGGSVSLSLKCLQRDRQRTTLRFSVTDTGAGIPEEKLHRLFSPFSQVDSSTARQFGGSGLGLAICKQLIELMGGTVGVTSRVGVGSTFWFDVPLQLLSDDTELARKRQVLAGARVLAVDGIDRERRQIGDCLRAWGCSVDVVATVKEALDAVQLAEVSGKPMSIVLADCRLAIGDEYILLQKLAETPRLPIIGLGSEDDFEAAAYLQRLGIRQLLHDPVRPSTLYDALTSVLAVTVVPAPRTSEPQVRQPVPVNLQAHILVAEDNHINQMFVVELLKYCGCTSDIAANGDAAVVAFDEKPYDLILMDCQMPEMDGFAATREIRRREATRPASRRIPIIALTANAMKGDVERCLDAGMDGYLSKPLQAAQLQLVLQKHLPVNN